MRIESLRKHVGQVVVLDLVMGREITTRVQEVADDGVVTCVKPRVFVPVPNPQNPSEMQVMCLAYGHPMYKADDLFEVDAAHVVTVFIPSAQQVDEYAKQTSSIVPAAASALDQLDNAGGSRLIGL